MPQVEEITYKHLNRSYELAQRFFGEPDADSINEHIVGKLSVLREKLNSIPGFCGCFGVGYPFYATTPSGDVLPVPSIKDFLSGCREEIEYAELRNDNNWPCPNCQEENQPADLGATCSPCKLVTFKPRDFFRGMPDIDVIAVFDELSDETKSGSEAAIKATGLMPFSQNIREAVNGTTAVLKGSSTAHLPLDFHMVSLQDFIDCCKCIISGETENQVGIQTSTLRVHWKNQPIDFSYSFAFSMSEIGELIEPLSTVVVETRRTLAQNLGITGIVAMVEKSRRCSAVIADQALRELLMDRVSKWA